MSTLIGYLLCYRKSSHDYIIFYGAPLWSAQGHRTESRASGLTPEGRQGAKLVRSTRMFVVVCILVINIVSNCSLWSRVMPTSVVFVRPTQHCRGMWLVIRNHIIFSRTKLPTAVSCGVNRFHWDRRSQAAVSSVRAWMGERLNTPNYCWQVSLPRYIGKECAGTLHVVMCPCNKHYSEASRARACACDTPEQA